MRPPRPASWPRVSAPLLSGYLAVAFRRGGLKTPGGSPLRPRGRGAVGPVGEPPGSPQTLETAPAVVAAPEARGRGVCFEPPLGARGARPARPARPPRAVSAGAGCG